MAITLCRCGRRKGGVSGQRDDNIDLFCTEGQPAFGSGTIMTSSLARDYEKA